MTNPPDFDDRLTSYLAAAAIRDVDPGASHIASRAQRRTKHRRMAGGALASVALLTSAGVVLNRLQTPGTVRTSSAKVKPAADDTTPTAETTVSPSPVSTAFARILEGQMASGGIDTSNLKWPASNITWQRVDPSLSISNTSGFPGTGAHKDGDTFLAVSTEPANGKLPNPNEPYMPTTALYSSTDGVSWQQRSVPDLAIGGATLAEGTLYAVGTATATAQVASNGSGNTVADLVVAVSKDGKTWKNQTLPLDVRSLANKGAQIAMGPALIAHSGSTVLVQSSVQVYLDPTKYLPKNVPFEQWGYEMRDGAFVVYGPPSAEALACREQQTRLQDGPVPPTVFATIPPAPTAPATTVVAVTDSNGAAPSTVPPGLSPACEAALAAPPVVASIYKFADVGVDPALVAAIQNPIHLYASTGGGPFVVVEAPDALGGQNTGTGFLTPVADGFLLSRTKYPNGAGGIQVVTTNIVHSTDGKTWTDFGSFNGQVVSSGVTGGHFTMVVNDEKGTKLVRLKNDGSGFEDVSDSSSPTSAALATMGYGMSIGDAGYLAAFYNGGPFTPAVSVKHNGYTFLVTQDPTTGMQRIKVTEDATGTVVADGPLSPEDKSDPNLKLDKHIKWSADSQTDISIVDDNNKTLVSIGVSDLFNQISQQQQAEATKSMRILDSQDGVTWAATSVSDLVDLTKVPVIGASNLIVDKDRYIVNLLVARTDGGPADTITFVGRRG
jgi:hypothetical protein